MSYKKREPNLSSQDTVPASLAELGTRIREVSERLGGKKTLAQAAQIRESQLYRYISGENLPGLETLLAIAKAAGVSPGWLLSGDEQPTGVELPSAPIRIEPDLPFDSGSMEGDDAKFVLVPRYDVRASAGAGAFADQNQVMGYLAFRRDWVRRTLGVDPNHLAIISAIGDSMEPTIRHGDVLLVQTTPVEHVIDGAVYVLARGDHLVVKRLQQFVTGALKVFSDNQAYETEVVDNGDAIAICGRVLWMGRTL